MSAHASSSSSIPPPLPPPRTLPPSSISPTLPSSSSSAHSPNMPSPSTHSPETQRQIAEARAALEASMTNIGSSLDSSLRSRAQDLHSNSKQLEKQQKDVVKATEALRKENDKLGKVAAEGSKRVKELGNVQNWAEMLERDFLVLSETLRLVERGSSSGESESDWETSSEGSRGDRGDGLLEGEWKFEVEEDRVMGESSAVGTPDGDGERRVVDAEGDVRMDELESGDADKGKGKGKAVEILMESAVPPEQHTEATGGSSTATATATSGTGTGSDPSSGSVHTAASAAS